MDGRNTTDILPILRHRLRSVTAAHLLVDELFEEQPHARLSAVLLPLFLQDGEMHLAFIRRAATLRAHGGEIAFPGGSADPDDISLIMTALREAHEEIGLVSERVEVLGLLSPVFTLVSNFLILPVVAYLPEGLGELLVQTSEVAELLLLPLRGLTNPAVAHREVWAREGRSQIVMTYYYENLRIWGATGRILSNLLNLLQDRP